MEFRMLSKKPAKASKQIFSIFIFALALGSFSICSATEPLHDQLEVGKQSGPFFPDKCCWIDMPKTEKMVEARLAERCSAIGGPVGHFRLEDNKIWLDKLLVCGGDIPLKKIYPELDSPAHAAWLNGVFFAKIEHACVVRADSSISGLKPLYRTTLRLEVKDGIITRMQRQENDTSICQKTPEEQNNGNWLDDTWRGETPPISHAQPAAPNITTTKAPATK